MAYDFIQGNTGTNWARGIKQLLPDSPDSTSMGRVPPPAPTRQIASALSRGRQTSAASPAISEDDETSRSSSSKASKSSDEPSSDPSSNDESDGWFNDDELAVAMDGGACEMEALARMRGVTWIGKKSKSSKPAPPPVSVRQVVQSVEQEKDLAVQAEQQKAVARPIFFPDVNSRPIKLYAHVSSTNDLTRPYRKQTGPHTWRTFYRPNSGKHRRRNYKVVRVNPVKFIRV